MDNSYVWNIFVVVLLGPYIASGWFFSRVPVKTSNQDVTNLMKWVPLMYTGAATASMIWLFTRNPHGFMSLNWYLDLTSQTITVWLINFLTSFVIVASSFTLVMAVLFSHPRSWWLVIAGLQIVIYNIGFVIIAVLN